jgi:hypothetical protein
MSAKLGNNNDNAFKMRKLFKMYDKQDSGLVSEPAVCVGACVMPPASCRPPAAGPAGSLTRAAAVAGAHMI